MRRRREEEQKEAEMSKCLANLKLKCWPLRLLLCIPTAVVATVHIGRPNRSHEAVIDHNPVVTARRVSVLSM